MFPKTKGENNYIENVQSEKGRLVDNILGRTGERGLSPSATKREL